MSPGPEVGQGDRPGRRGARAPRGRGRSARRRHVSLLSPSRKMTCWAAKRRGTATCATRSRSAGASVSKTGTARSSSRLSCTDRDPMMPCIPHGARPLPRSGAGPGPPSRPCRRAGRRGRRRPWGRSAAGSWISPLGRAVAGLQLARALELGVHLGAQQDRDVREVQPQQADDDPGHRAVGLVVGAEVRHVEGEERRDDDPQEHREHGTGAEEGPLGQPDVRRRAVEQGEHGHDDDEQHGPLRDVPDRHGGRPEADRVADAPGQRARDDEREQHQGGQQDEDEGHDAAGRGAASRTGAPRRPRRSRWRRA